MTYDGTIKLYSCFVRTAKNYRYSIKASRTCFLSQLRDSKCYAYSFSVTLHCMSTKCCYCLSRYTFVHPFLWYRQLLLEVIWESLGFFLDRVAAEMFIGLTISIWKWNEWCKLQIFVEMSINCCFELRNFWGYKTYCDRSIYGGEYSCYGKFIGKKG